MNVRRWATVRVRVTAAAVVIVALVLALSAVWLVRSHRASLTHDIEITARQRASEIASSITGNELTASLAAPHNDTNLVQVVDESGRIVAASTNVRAGRRISELEPGAEGIAARTVDHLPGDVEPYRVVARRVTTPSSTYTVYVATSLDAVRHSNDNLIRLLLIGLPFVLLVVGVTTWFMTGLALRPVEAIRAEVESIGVAQDPTRRVPEPGTGDEIGRLAHTMNTMLARLGNSIDRQRQFVDDASHELRSPLTSIRTQIEVELAHPDTADWQATDRGVLDDTIRLQRLVDDLLALARADSAEIGSTRREPVDLDEIVLRESRRLRERTTHHVDTTAVSGAQLIGNPDDLERAVRNLFDNADRHAESTITVTLDESEQSVTLVVADDGPGVPVERREQIFERFTRLGNARGRDDGGTGLGLAITHDIVVAHGGTISLVDAAGARFVARFPVELSAT
jgi:signal transduction histidine kinase